MKWFHFILSHSLFIALCAVALAFQTHILLSIESSIYNYGFIFFATLSSYNFYWLLSKYSFSQAPNFILFLRKESSTVIVMVLAFLGLLFCLQESTFYMPYIVTAAILTIIYTVPLLPFSVLHFSRRAGFLKTILLSLAWTYVTAFLPMQKIYVLLNAADLFILSRRFLFMMVLCIIFDNRDIAIDKIRGLHSLATDLKPNILRLLMFAIFGILFISNFYTVLFGFSYNQSIALQVTTISLLVIYLLSARKRGYLFYYFIVDGMMIFSALATYIASI